MDLSKKTYRLKEVRVQAEALRASEPFLPDVEGTQLYAGKKTAVIDLTAQPAIVNNNYRQLLEKTPGLLLSEETTPLLSIGYRGLAPDRLQFMQVLKDGVPIQAELFGYPEAYYTPPFQSIDRIEFIHGGASLMYGPQPGGALNFITKPPATDTPFAAYSENTFGTDELFSDYTAVTGTLTPFGYRGYFHERQGNGFRETGSDFEVLGGGVKVTYEPPTPAGAQDGTGTADSRLTLTYDEYHEEHGEPGGLTKAVADSEGRDRTTRVNDRFRLARYYGTLLYEQHMSEDTELAFRTFGGYYQRWSKRQNGGGFGTVPTGTTNSIQEQDFYTLGVEPRLRHTYDLFGQPGQALTLGLLTYFSHSPREDRTGATAAADSGPLSSSSDRNMQYLSLFAEQLFRVGPFSLTPGVRLEHIWQHVKETANTSKTSVPLGDEDEFDFVPLFGVGAAYDVTPAMRLYSNVSQSYRPKLFTQSVPTGATQVVNDDLEEGKSWTVDAGIRGRAVQAINWDVSYFLLRFEDQVGTAGNTVANVGDAIHQGLELAVDADLVGWYDATRQTAYQDRWGTISPFFNLMLLDAKFTEGPQDGKTPQYAPQYTMRFGVEYAFKDRVKARIGSTFVDDHFGDDANTANQTIPSYNVWDLTGEVRLYKNYVSLVGGINNLLNERYYARVTSGGIDPAYERNNYGGIRVGVKF
ncbi:MAG: TonB-dependent receptor plug domain-containing protein [Candidatus Omnitrophica bacterium]|nr:TonB-dependent receptor plug domain-containing protein [Candidatus Omnitrophota bacterium]